MSKHRHCSRRTFLRVAATSAAIPLARVRRAHAAQTATGVEHPELAAFDRLMVDFMREQEVVGASIAVTKDSRLVYARGFGLADRDRQTPVLPDSLFRIASISKPLTGTAILQLIERGRLDLDAPVCKLLELSPTDDDRWQKVTVRQLLHHTGGWDRDKSFDPMFRSVRIAKKFDVPSPAMQEQIIRYMLAQPLDFDPGANYAYSNFGYCLLGRIIERVSRMPYERYVKRNVLAPVQVNRMRLGATMPAGRAKHEVCYYDRNNRTAPAVMGKVGEQVPRPYGAWCLEAMDSHGGWLASAVDLVRFASAFDAPRRCPILRPPMIETLFARPPGASSFKPDGSPKEVFYACGWSGRTAGGGQNSWHNGALDGTSTLLVRRHDGLNWAVLFNCRQTPAGKELAATIDPLVHAAASEVKSWPAVDHFRALN